MRQCIEEGRLLQILLFHVGVGADQWDAVVSYTVHQVLDISDREHKMFKWAQLGDVSTHSTPKNGTTYGKKMSWFTAIECDKFQQGKAILQAFKSGRRVVVGFQYHHLSFWCVIKDCGPEGLVRPCIACLMHVHVRPSFRYQPCVVQGAVIPQYLGQSQDSDGTTKQ